jgi:glycosyltransferase involved in cell wall biosynthesis
MLLSILIPVLDFDDELTRLLYSIVTVLDVNDYEIIIILPKSKSRYFNFKNDVKLKVISEKSRGIYSAINQGIKESKGDYFYIIGKDDFIFPNFSKGIQILKELEPYVLFANVNYGGKGVYSGMPSKYKIIFKNICQQGVIYSKQTVVDYGFFIYKFINQADHYLSIQLLWESKKMNKIIYLNETIAYYAGTGFSSKNRDVLFRKLMPLILKKKTNQFIYMIFLCLRYLSSIKNFLVNKTIGTA